MNGLEQAQQQAQGSIIYVSPALDVFVLDIPTSIAEAQRFPTAGTGTRKQLYSCAPLREPHPSLEPKNAEKTSLIRAQRRQDSEDAACDDVYVELITDALVHIREIGKTERFCLERCIAPGGSVGNGKKKRKHDDSARGVEDFTAKVDGLLQRLAEQGRSSSEMVLQDQDDKVALTSSFIHNPKSHPQRLVVRSSPTDLTFSVPPRAAALNTTAALGPLTLTSLASFHAADAARFPLILMDPPWPNRSARRKASYQTYTRDGSAMSISRLKDLLLDLQLENHVMPNGYIAVWITNRASTRHTVLDLFDAWDVRLCEEWIWAKVTGDGRPVTDLHGVWRRPWEVLLVGQRGGKDKDGGEREQIKRRVVCAVPDLHSRKPCLKGLFERILLPLEDPRTISALAPSRRSGRRDGSLSDVSVLEIFARHMVAGWMSWGDEALKFQWEGRWTNHG